MLSITADSTRESKDWLSPVPEVEVGGACTSDGSPIVRARKDIARGSKFGPFLGKWASEPFDLRYAWEVSVNNSLFNRINVTNRT